MDVKCLMSISRSFVVNALTLSVMIDLVKIGTNRPAEKIKYNALNSSKHQKSFDLTLLSFQK